MNTSEELRGLAGVTKSAALVISRRRIFKSVVAATASAVGLGLLRPLTASAVECSVCYGQCSACSSSTGSCCKNGYCYSASCSCGTCGTCGNFRARQTVCSDGSHSAACPGC